MKHNLWATVEVIGWMVLGVAIATMMASSPLTRHETNLNPAISALQLLAVIVIGGVVMYFAIRYWKEMPKWVAIANAVAGALIIVVALARSSMMGVEFLINERLPFAWIIVFAVLAVCIITAVRTKFAWAATMRANTVMMLLVFGAASAMIAQYLNVFWAVVLLAGIAVYDAIAVWVVGSMQATVEELKKVGFLPAITVPKKGRRKEMALLGGGDVVFISVLTIVFARETTYGVAVATGMLSSVIALFFAAERGKSYPAIPFIFAGMVFGLIVATVVV